MPTITPFLWFDTQAEEAMNFYASIFKRSKVISVNRAQGKVMSVQFELEGQQFMALNAGPTFKFNEAISFFVGCETQQEIDELWAKLTADGGAPGRCGWLKDKFGLSWQIVPNALGADAGRQRPRQIGTSDERDAPDGQARPEAAAAGIRGNVAKQRRPDIERLAALRLSSAAALPHGLCLFCLTRFAYSSGAARRWLLFGARGRRGRFRGRRRRQVVRLLHPVGQRGLDLVPMPDLDEVRHLGLRDAIDATHLRRLQRPAEKDAELEEALLRPNEEVAGLAREHDRTVGRVDALFSQSHRGLAQTVPRVLKVLGEVPRERRLGGRPAVVRLALFDPLFAVVALSTGHAQL